MGNQIDRRDMRTSVGTVALVGAGVAGTMASASAAAQAVEVGGQAYVAIQVARWQLTADGQARVTSADGSTHSLAAGDFQIIDGRFYALESLVGTDGSALFEAGLIVAGGAGALVLGALALTAGGDGGTNDGPTQAQGTVLKGPLSDAFVYYDANGNGQFDADEVNARTQADGTYDLNLSGVTEHAPNAAVIVTTGDQTVDTASGAILSGIMLKAAAGSSVITPLTTLMAETGLGSDALKQALGLTGNQDLSAFNPYADGVDANEALATEQASAQVASTLAGLASAAIGAGAEAEAAYAAALAALRAVVEAQANAGTPLDLSQAGDGGHLDEIQTAFTNNIAGAQGLDAAALDAVIGDAVQAIGTVNDAIGDLDDTNLTADSNKGAFGLIQVMQDDIEQALATGGDIALADITDDGLEALIANLAPTDIALAGANGDNEISIAEDTSELTLGALSAVDTDADGAESSGSVRFEIALVDGVAVTPESGPFEIDAQNNLLFTAQPDFETKSSYRVTIHATDAGGKTYAETFVINITDANDAAVISGDTSGSVTEDGTVDASGNLSVTDVDSGEAVFTVQDNSTTTYGAFSIDALGAWTYSLDNSNAAVQGLGEGDSLTDSITVTSADGTTQTITITINGANDAAQISGDTSGSVTEDGTVDASGNLSVTDVDSGEAVFTVQDNSTTTYGAFSIDALGAWTYSLDNSNTAVQGLGDGDSLTDTISVAATDGTTQTITITIQGANDAPDGQADIVETNEETILVIDVADLLANDSDVDGDTLSVITVGNALNGAVSLDGDVITFAPNLNFFTDTENTASFTYNIGDGAGGTAIDILVTVNVVPQPDAPTLRGPREGEVTEDGSDLAGGTVNVADFDKDESGFRVSTQTSNYGTFAITQGGDWTYRLNNASGDVQALGGSETHEDTFTAQTLDGTEVQFTITIIGTNDVPVLEGESEKSFSIDERGVQTGYTPNATDQDANDKVTFAIAGPDGDLFKFDPATGELLFRSAPNFERPLGSEGGQNEELGNTYVIEIIATDDQGAQDAETIRINVTDVEEPNPLAEFIQGLDANALLGSSMSILGDINGDGVDDLIVTRPGVAESYIVFGTDGGSIWANTDGIRIPDIVLTGGAVTSVAAGDIDGDGLNDIVLGVSEARSAAGNAAGKTFVIYGKNTFDDQQTLVDPFNTSINLALEVEASTADRNPLGFVLEGASEGDLSGFAVAVADNDLGAGSGQLLIGAPGFSTTYSGEDGSGAYEAQTGRVYVIQGQSGDARLYGSHSLADVGEENGLTGFYDASEVDIGFRLNGFSLSSSGDINGDSIADFVGTGFDALYGPLVAFALFGQDPWPNGPVDLSDPNQNPSVIVTGFDTNINSIDIEDASQLVSIIGDINGDGVDDVLVGDPHWYALDEGTGAEIEDIGRSYVIFGPKLEAGQTQQSVVLDVVDDIVRGDGSLGFVINNAYQDEQHGYAVAAAGDVNGDDIDDLIVTNPGAVWTVPDGEGFSDVNAGAAIVIFGRKDGFDSMLDPWSVNGTDGFIITGPVLSEAGFGTTVMSQPGDINNDGFDDIVLGLPEWSSDTVNGAGAIYTIYGQSIFNSHVFF